MYIPIFTKYIRSYLLWSPVISDAGRGGGGGVTGKVHSRARVEHVIPSGY